MTQSRPRTVLLDSPDLLTMEEAAKLLGLGGANLAHYHVKRAGLTVIRLGRLHAIRRVDLPQLSAAVAEARLLQANTRAGLSPDGRRWGPRRSAQALGVSIRTLRRLAERGEVPGRREGSSWWFNPEEVIRLAAKERR